MARDVLARHNVVAIYPRIEEARAALSALEGAGFDADAVEGAVKLLREEGAEMIDRYDHEGRRVDIAG